MQAYKDLKVEIDVLAIRAADLEHEYQTLYDNCFSPGRMPRMPLDKATQRLEEIKAQHDLLAELLTAKRAALSKMDVVIQESLNARIAVMRDVEGKSLPEIAAEVGCSLSAIKKRSARLPRVV